MPYYDDMNNSSEYSYNYIKVQSSSNRVCYGLNYSILVSDVKKLDSFRRVVFMAESSCDAVQLVPLSSLSGGMHKKTENHTTAVYSVGIGI